MQNAGDTVLQLFSCSTTNSPPASWALVSRNFHQNHEVNLLCLSHPKVVFLLLQLLSYNEQLVPVFTPDILLIIADTLDRQIVEKNKLWLSWEKFKFNLQFYNINQIKVLCGAPLFQTVIITFRRDLMRSAVYTTY